ncbi:MAG: hypothetical protein BGO41_08715 [Clostridiales bacterium 38-18]|nr:MAG: hypothetical protein BGO41_08715 [Clostridiales bacterium 38-18]
MKQSKLLNGLNAQTGAISIFVVIIIPVVIIGSFLIYQLVESYKSENDMQKIAHATSDAIISRYSGIMMSRFGMLATPIDQPIEKLVQKYASLNGITDSAHQPDVLITYEQISNPENFSNALKQAALSSKCVSLVAYGTSLLEQNKNYARFQSKINALQYYEKKAFDWLDFEGVEDDMKKVNTFGSLSEMKNDINELMNKIQSIEELFEVDYQDLQNNLYEFQLKENDLDTKAIFTNLEENYQSGKADFFSKIDQLTIILNRVSQDISTLSEVETSISDNLNRIEALGMEIEALNESIAQIENNEYQIDPLESNKNESQISLTLEKIDQMNVKLSSLLNQNTDLYKMSEEIRQKIQTELNQFVVNQQKSLYLKILDALATLNSLFENFVIEDKTIALKDTADYRNSTGVIQYDLTTRILVSEYLLSIFNSYDQNCPRKIPYGERLSEARLIKGEIEFILTGIENQRQSMTEIKMKVLGIRVPFNLISLIQSKSQMNQINLITAAVPQPWRIFAYTGAIAMWTTAESYIDVNELLKGNAIPIIKRSEEWYTSLEGILSQNRLVDHVESPTDHNQTQFGIYYMDYLRLLLYMQDDNKTVKRTMSLFAHELSTLERESGLDDFAIGHELKIVWEDLSGFHYQTRQYLLVNQLAE